MNMESLQAVHRACTRCVQAGFIPVAHPVFSGRAGQRILLVGQAPGPVEQDAARPFAGRAGRQLVRWMTRAGFRDEDDFRDRVYITSMTTCFPGRTPAGTGDRRPTAREVSMCGPWLDQLLERLAPRLIIPVGGLAHGRFLPGRRLDDLIGWEFAAGGGRGDMESAPSVPVIVPLPHPSGQSRWLNDPERARRLDRALRRLEPLVKWAEQPVNGMIRPS